MLRYAIKVISNTLPLIQKLNDGVTPKIETTPTYFLSWANDASYNEILSEREFFDVYRYASRSDVIQVIG